jgi:malate dehydrogenase (oxaloacetate-decarboxylating)(NADP+)
MRNHSIRRTHLQGKAMKKTSASENQLPKGGDLLCDSMLNKGSAFTEKERENLGLLGLLPPRVNSIENQSLRVMENLRVKTSPLEKYVYLTSLQDRNKTLFYRVLVDHIEELMPIVYTPTVGQACLEYGHVFRSGIQGLFIASEHRGRIREVLGNWPSKDVRIIVVTDGERILGLGDLGVDGMGIPIGKLTLYAACAGIHPDYCLPVTLDVGTDNEKILNDPLYIGMPHRRLRGQEYDDLIEEFVRAANEAFPRVLIQFEDFANWNAFRLLQKYRNRVCMFNDDIQGTAGVALAGLYSAVRITGNPLKTQKILFVGAGEAGLGMGSFISAAMVKEGLSEKEARSRCAFLDSKGLLVTSRKDLDEGKRRFALDCAPIADCLSAVEFLKPTAIIGASGKQGMFSREILEAMARITPRPIIFAMSNPTSLSECTAEEAYKHTRGRAIFASGSPFMPVRFEGNVFVPGQSNNTYIFPGVGLGVVSCRVRHVTDEMFFMAAKTLSNMVSEDDLAVGRLYPSLQKIREISLAIAESVASVAFEQGLAEKLGTQPLHEVICSQMYQPVYRQYI